MKFFRPLFISVLLSLFLLILHGCGSMEGRAWRYDPGIPGPVTALTAEAGNKVVTLSWTPPTVAEWYEVYYVSSVTGEKVTRSNATRVRSDQKSIVIQNLQNDVEYHFMVTAVNKDGESVDSSQVSGTPLPPVPQDLVGVWYFSTLVTGPDARWERGTLTIDDTGNGVISDFEDSASNTTPPPPIILSMDADGQLSQTGSGAWVDFHGILGSRKNMIASTWAAGLQSRALTIFQKRKSDSAPAYSTQDISGTGSGQNPYNPYIQGNGPTRFAYHQLYSGSSTEWEYANAKVGQHGNIWTLPGDPYKDIIYWDFSTPFSKTVNYDYLWKCTSVGVDSDGVVSEYWNFSNVVSPEIPNYNTLVPKQPHEVVFKGRMTADKTVVIGVGTTTDLNGNNPRYYLRIVQLCFIPTDQALPSPGLGDLAGSYRFNKLASSVPTGGTSATASSAYGSMVIGAAGDTTFPSYVDSMGNSSTTDAFSLAYYPDPNPDLKVYTDFANFTTSPQDGRPHYFDSAGNALRKYYDFASFGSYVGVPSTWRLEDTSSKYYNEHASLSYNRDLLVMTRTDSSGYSMLIGLK